MIITQNTGGNSGLCFFSIEGLVKTKRNEKIVTNFLTQLYDTEMYNSVTLNNWKGHTLEIRYARSLEEYNTIMNGRESDKSLPENHPERSLLY